MPDFSVLADVSETLETVLTDALSTLAPGPPVAEVNDLITLPPANPPRVTLFLFEVTEDPTQRNRPPVRAVAPPNLTSEKPPMALRLRYLITPWGGDVFTDQRMLGRVLEVLYDDAILNGPQLRGGLAGTSQALKVTLAQLTLEERTRIWHAIQHQFRLSVIYELRVVNLDSLEQRTQVPVQVRAVGAGQKGDRRMIGWTPIPGERRVLYSPVGLRLVDDLTGTAPASAVRAELDEQDANGIWHLTRHPRGPVARRRAAVSRSGTQQPGCDAAGPALPGAADQRLLRP